MSRDTSTHRAETPNALPPGTRLGEFEVLSLLGVGGFGIVYLAFDHALEREVAVKEYMPVSMAGRTETMQVSVRSHSDMETFALGLKSFVNEARLLARFDHPSLLKVLRFWEANGTAYMAMPVLHGRTIKQARVEMPGPPDEAWLRGLLDPLLGAIERLHDAGVYHRDIAPDNIQIELDGHPVLLDFGAARRVISDKTQSLTAILKPAYAPIEQYAEVGAVKQGPWTDLYALGATLHYMLLGRPPAPATARTVHDEASLLTTDNLPGCSASFLQVVDWMLSPRPADRPQSVAALRDALAGRRAPPQRREADAPTSRWERTEVLPPPAPEVPLDLDELTQLVATPAKDPEVTDLVLPDIVATKSPATVLLQPATAAPPQPTTALETAAAPAQRSKLLPVAIGLVALGLVAVAAVMLWPQAPGTPAAASLAASAAAPAAAASVAPRGDATRPESAITTVVVKPVPVAATAAPRAASGAVTAAASAPASAPNEATRTPTEAAPVAAATVPTAAPAAAPPKPVPGPEARCGGRNPVDFFVCMERECARGEFQSHADCRNWRKEATKR